MAVASVEAIYAAIERRGPEHLRTISVKAFGLSLSIFFAFSFLLCVLGYLLEQTFHLQLQIAHGALAIVLPGFQLNSWPRFFLGLAESFAWGWYIALIFGPLYNFFALRSR